MADEDEKIEQKKEWWDVHYSKRDLIILFWVFVTVVAMAVGIIIAVHNTDTVDKLGKQNNQTIQAIKVQRYQSRLTACRDQNMRYINTLGALKKLTHQELTNTPTQIVGLFKDAGVNITNPQPIIELERQSIKGSYASTAGLISALAPFNPNCKQYARGTG